MKRSLVIVGIAVIFVAEIIALSVFAASAPNLNQDAVAVNEIVHIIESDWGDLDAHVHASAYDYVVIDLDGELVYASREGLSETIASAVVNRDTVLDLEVGGNTVGKVIIYNDSEVGFQAQKRVTVTVLAIAIALEFAVCVIYAAYLHRRVIRPFEKMRSFAERVACGNLDIPLEMDKHNMFGAFTESFDIMRSELKAAKIAEAQAQESKKELVAKLSHDIKTPVASIAAVAEVGLASSKSASDKERYGRISEKASQINSLVSNLFTATLQDLQKLSVSPCDLESNCIRGMLESSDYLNKARIPEVPECLVYADKLRLQQVFDNIFANAYKYAGTDIAVTARRQGEAVIIEIEDFGGGVPNSELPYIKEKFKRGGNAAKNEGAGLGLYISDYFMSEMGGALYVENGSHGLKVTVEIAQSGAK